MDTLPVAAPPPNPWRTMWFSPRVTMRRLLEAETRPSWIPVVALAAVSSALSSIQLDEAGALSASRSAMPVIIGSLQVIFGVLVGPFLLAFVGGWLGGEADPADIREVLAWSYVPIAVGSVLWIPLVLTLGPARSALIPSRSQGCSGLVCRSCLESASVTCGVFH